MAKPTKAEINKRIASVAHYLLQGYCRSNILRNASTQWGVTDRTTDSYLKKARELIQLDTESKIEVSKAFHLKIRLDNYRELVAEKKKILENKKLDTYKKTICLTSVSKQILELLKDMAKIDGLYVKRLDHTSGGKPIGKSLWDDE